MDNNSIKKLIEESQIKSLDKSSIDLHMKSVWKNIQKKIKSDKKEKWYTKLLGKTYLIKYSTYLFGILFVFLIVNIIKSNPSLDKSSLDTAKAASYWVNGPEAITSSASYKNNSSLHMRIYNNLGLSVTNNSMTSNQTFPETIEINSSELNLSFDSSYTDYSENSDYFKYTYNYKYDLQNTYKEDGYKLILYKYKSSETIKIEQYYKDDLLYSISEN